MPVFLDDRVVESHHSCIAVVKSFKAHTVPAMMPLWSIALLASIAAAQDPFFAPFPDCTKGVLSTNNVCNTKLSPSQRAAALVAVLTTDEKLKNLVR